jgi:peroxiredoxin
VRILAISPDPPEVLSKAQASAPLPFSLLSDPEGRIVNRCTVAHCYLLLDGNGLLRWAGISESYAPIAPEAVLQAAWRLRDQ